MSIRTVIRLFSMYGLALIPEDFFKRKAKFRLRFYLSLILFAVLLNGAYYILNRYIYIFPVQNHINIVLGINIAALFFIFFSFRLVRTFPFDAESKRQKMIINSLQELSIMTNTEIDDSTLMNRLLEHLKGILDYDSAGILLLSENSLVVSHGINLQDSIVGKKISLHDDSLEVRVFKLKSSFLVKDMRLYNNISILSGTHEVHSWIGAPMFYREKEIGIMYADSSYSDCYTEADKNVFQLFANQAAIALENSHLVETSKRLQLSADTLRKTNQELTQSLELEKIFDTLLDSFKELVDYDSATIFLVDEHNVLTAQSVRGYDEILGPEIGKLAASVKFHPKQGTIPYTIMKNEKSYYIPDVFDTTGWIVVPTSSHIRSYLGVPMRASGKMIGMCSLDSIKENHFSEETIMLAESVASQAAFAIQNARLYQLTENQKQEAESSAMKILDSINYAKIIQQSILPNYELILQTLPDSFFLWRPRDIVGGDLYLIEFTESGTLIMLIDCTGHGVPGAFMTMLASSALKHIIHDKQIYDPAEILRTLNLIIKKELGTNSEFTFADDGLDAAVTLINYKTMELTFAGARIPLYISHNGKVEEIKGSMHSIGYKGFHEKAEFSNSTINIISGMTFYLSTDGFIHQIGGPKNYSLGKSNFIRLLQSLHKYPMQEQESKLLDGFNTYRGLNKQVDDVTVIGFQINE
jgi:serine phosphatase RsbU (regulator of sigma subunit)